MDRRTRRSCSTASTRPLGPQAVRTHYQSRVKADVLAKLTVPSGRVQAEMRYDVVNDRLREVEDENGGLWKIEVPAVTGNGANIIRTTRVTDPGGRYHFYDFDPKRGRVLRYIAPLGLTVRNEDMRDTSGKPTAPAQPTCPTTTTTTTAPADTPPSYCGGPGTSPGGWIGGPVNGQGVRTFEYDDNGFQSTITDENGNKVVLTNDARGNLVSRKTCRVQPTDCQTSYSSYYLNPADLTDPRNDKLTESRDARSTSATDNRYLTKYEYTGTGQRGLLERLTSPGGAVVTRTYTDLNTPAFDTGNAPAGLVATTQNSLGAVVEYRYFRTGDLAEEKERETGLVTRYTYDVLGRQLTRTQISAAYPQGLTTTFAYDELNRRTTSTDPATTNAVTGVKHTPRVTTTYDEDGRPTRIDLSDVTGGQATRTTINSYDGRGRLAITSDAEGGKTFYGYDVFGNKTSMVDAGGTKYEYAYTGRNKIAEVRLRSYHGDPVVPGEGEGGDSGTGVKEPGATLVLQSFTYDLAGRTIREVDAMGRTKQFTYYNDDRLKQVIARGVRNPFDASAQPRDVVLEENFYDGAGNPVRQVTPGNRVTTNGYDDAGRVAWTELDPGGLKRRTEFTYDTEGNWKQVKRTGLSSNSVRIDTSRIEVVDYVYDKSGRLLTETVANPAGTPLVTTRGYDSRGLMTTVTDPRNNVTDLGYDEAGRLVSTTSPAVQVETNGGAAVTARPQIFVGRDTFGEQTQAKDPNGNVTTTVRDRLGRVVRSESPDYGKPGETTSAKAVTSTKYDALGHPIEVTDPRGAVTKLRYDQLGRLREKEQPAPGGTWSYTYTRVGEELSRTDPTGARVEATYDDLGRQVTSTNLERTPAPAAYTTKLRYDDANNLRTVESPAGELTTHEYDVLGSRTKTTDPAGVITQYGYDLAGNQVRVSDGLGRTTFTRIDATGRPANSYQLDAAEAILRTTSQKFDGTGNLVESRNALGDAVTFTYDAAGRLTEQTEPVDATRSITTRFGYDAAGNRTRFTDGRTNSTVYTYNALGLPESVLEPATAAHPAESDRKWTVSYDLAGNPERTQAPSGVTRTRTFDLLGRLKQETGSGAEAATTTRVLDYDLAGRLTSFSGQSGTNVLTYNDRGALLTATGPSGNSSFTYDENGRQKTQTDAGGTTTNSYVDGQLKSVQDGATGAMRTLAYNAAGQPETVTYGPGNTRTFGYDAFGRLSSDSKVGTYEYDLTDRLKRKVTGGVDNIYDYDRSGRLKSWTAGTTVTAYEWDDAGNRVKAGTRTATFDERNRLKTDGDQSYTWSARGTVLTRTGQDGTTAYEFDAFDRTVKRGATTFGYDALNRTTTRNGTAFAYVGSSLNVASDGTTSYSRGPDGSLLSLKRGTDRRTLLTDQHGDVVGGFDPSASVLADITVFDPFGKVVSSTGTRPSLGYQGDWTDPDSGEVDLGARWYDPAAGRFTARDNVSLAATPSAGTNRYAYANADPMGMHDPDGHSACGTKTKPSTGGFLSGVQDLLDSTRCLLEPAVEVGSKIGRIGSKIGRAGNAVSWIVDFFEGTPTASGCMDQLYVNGVPCPGTVKPQQNTVSLQSILSGIVNVVATGLKYLSEALNYLKGLWTHLLDSLRRVSNVVKEIGEFIAKNVKLPTLKEALKPHVADGPASSDPDLPAVKVGDQQLGVQDESSANERIREMLLGADKTVIRNLEEATPSELISSSVLYDDGNAFRVVRNADGTLSHRQIHWNVMDSDLGPGPWDLRYVDPLAAVPDYARIRELKPAPNGGAQYGLEYIWRDTLGRRIRLRIHGPDSTAPPGSNAAQGDTYRVQIGRQYQNEAGFLHHPNVHNQNSPHYDPNAANETHIPWPQQYPGL